MAMEVKGNAKILAALIVFLMIVPVLFAVISQGLAAQVNVQGDEGKINVSVSSFSPLLDKYGKPSVNPDGTFYPNDKFTVAYDTFVADGVTFEGVDVAYNQSAFSMFSNTNWGAKTGTGSFQVKTSAAAGTYNFSIKASGSTLFDRGSQNSGTVVVTHGGVNVDAYYAAQYLLDVGISNPSEGTTNPEPNQYWLNVGTIMTVTAQPGSGYVFSYWILDGGNASSSNAITVFMNSYHSLQACFKQAGNVTVNIVALTNMTSGITEAEQASFQTSQDQANALSTVTFTSHGLGIDATGPVLGLDGGNQVDAGQLPAEYNWNVSSMHTYSWSETVGSSNVGKRYVLSQVTVKEHYVSVATVQVEVVKYDPHFTLALSYTVPNSNGSSSYDKPFAMIIRFDGNGPSYNLEERAVIEDYSWDSYASKMAEIENMGQTLTPNVTIANFFNHTSTAQFSAFGIDRETDKPILIVDGENFGPDGLPKTFNWEDNSNHTFAWTQSLPVLEYVIFGNLPMKVESSYEWLEWQFSMTFPPSTNQIDLTQANQTLNQTDLQNQLMQQFNSPSGTATATPLGNTVTAFYADNKLLEKFALETGVSQEQALKCLIPLPIYFDNGSRYAKTEFVLDPTVAKRVVTQNFTAAIYYNVTFENSMFGAANNFQANFTCPYEFYTKQANVTAYKWDATLGNWSIDDTVRIQATFNTAFNFTETDVLRSDFENQTSDQEALKLAADDLYECAPQTFTGTGTVEGAMNRTSPLYYNLDITAGQNGDLVTLQKTVQINFRNNETYKVPVNFDSSSPLQVNVTEDDIQNSQLTLNAPMELGGLTNVSVYVVTSAPSGYALNEVPVNQTALKLLTTVNLTLPETQVVVPPEYQQNYQMYQYYEGYSSIYEGALGFSGQTQISISKDQRITALPGYNATLLYVEAQNVWGIKIHAVVAVQPYSIPHWEVLLNELGFYLFLLISVAIVVSLAVYIIKGRA